MDIKDDVFDAAHMIDSMVTCLITLNDETFRALERSGYGSPFKGNHDAMESVIDVIMGQVKKLKQLAE